MGKIVNEILVVEVEFPWSRLSSWSEEQIEKMRADYIKSCLSLKFVNSITLIGVMKAVGSGGYEEKDSKIEI